MNKSIAEQLFSWWRHRVVMQKRYGSKKATAQVTAPAKKAEPVERYAAPDGIVCSSLKELLEYVAGLQGNYWR